MTSPAAGIARPRSLVRSDAFQRVLAFGALIVLIVFFSVANEHFLNFGNFVNILIATAVVGVIALGETFVIITGGIDLSVGTVMTLSSVMTAVAITNMGLPIWAGVIAGVGTGGVMGLLNGVLIARLKLPPFIATLGTLNIARGLALVITQTRPIYFTNTPGFQSGVMGNLFGISIQGDFGIPNIAIIMFVAMIVAAFILNRTVLGRYTFALGSNEEAARLSGVTVQWWKMAVYVVGGLFAGLAGRADQSARQLRPAGARFRLRARRDLGRRHRRHLARGRRGHDPRHDHRRLHRPDAHKRPPDHERSRRNGRSSSPVWSSSSPSTSTSSVGDSSSRRSTSEVRTWTGPRRANPSSPA